ncbi:MAG: cell division protein FtsA [Candidatus Berkelbacteria bacterium]|nr:cell division protein FtsA [Candidatus Berkelbacteria bacterium]
MPARKAISVGLDIGSSKVAVCVVSQNADAVDILAVGRAKTTGVRKGVIVDVEETVSSITAALDEACKLSDFEIGSAVVGIGGSHLTSETSRGVIAVSKVDGEITEADVSKVIEAAKAVPNQPNREVLHVIPKTFIVDGQEGIINPVGMSGIRLEVDTNIISGSLSAIKNLARATDQVGLAISEMVFSPLATAKVILSKQQQEIGVILIDIGAGTTSYAVFEEGDLLHSGVLPIGSDHITNDIAIGLRTNINLAEIIKIKYGYATPEKINEKEEIDLAKLDKTEEGTTNVKYVAEIIEARLNEIFMLIRDDLRAINRDGMLPAGVVLTGGGAKLEGIQDLVKDILRLPSQIGKPQISLSGLVDNVADPVYATSCGLAIWGLVSGGQTVRRTPGTEIGGIVDKLKNTFKHFLP